MTLNDLFSPEQFHEAIHSQNLSMQEKEETIARIKAQWEPLIRKCIYDCGPSTPFPELEIGCYCSMLCMIDGVLKGIKPA